MTKPLVIPWPIYNMRAYLGWEYLILLTFIHRRAEAKGREYTTASNEELADDLIVNPNTIKGMLGWLKNQKAIDVVFHNGQRRLSINEQNWNHHNVKVKK